MKRIALLTLVSTTLLISNITQAQDVPVVGKFIPKPDLGLKIGANFNQLSDNGGSFKKAYKPGILFGAFGGVHWKKVGIRVEAMVNSASYTYSYTSTQDGTFKNLYLDVPVLFEYRLIPRVWLQVGPQFSDLIGVTANPNPDPANSPKSYFNSSDISGVLGLEVRLPLHLIVGARYILGFSNINNQSVSGDTNAWNTRTIQLFAGFRFL